MTTPLPAPSQSRFIPDLGQVYNLILSWHLRLKNNPLQTASDMTPPTNPSPDQSGDSHE